MFALKDLMELMDRWDAWKATKAEAAKVPDLEKRVAELENLLNGKAPAEYCRKCGERAARMVGTPMFGQGSVGEHFVCGACKARDTRYRKL